MSVNNVLNVGEHRADSSENAMTRLYVGNSIGQEISSSPGSDLHVVHLYVLSCLRTSHFDVL